MIDGLIGAKRLDLIFKACLTCQHCNCQSNAAPCIFKCSRQQKVNFLIGKVSKYHKIISNSNQLYFFKFYTPLRLYLTPISIHVMTFKQLLICSSKCLIELAIILIDKILSYSMSNQSLFNSILKIGN